jgi:hypothetical protein
MIFAVLICISLVLLGGCWFFYRLNIELFLCLLIAINFELFYLAPQIQGPDNYKLLLLPIIIILMIESFITRKLALGRYGWWVISFLGLSAVAVIVAYFSGQSLDLGIKAAKYVPLILVYFLVAGRNIDADKFSRYFVAMALVVAAIAAIQYYFPPRLIIFPGMPEGMRLTRLDTPRVTIGQFVISAAAVMAFAQYKLNSNKYFLLAAAMLFLEVLLIQQTRAFIAGIFISVILMYLLLNKMTTLRLSLYLIIVGVFLSALLIVGTDIYDIGLVKRTGADISQRTGSYQGRINAYKYYWQEIEKKPLLGRGLLNFNWQGNKEKYLQTEKGIHLSDIGITHFIVQAGLVGFLWFIYGLYKIWGDIFRFRRYMNITSYFMLATFTMLTIDMFLRADSMFLFAAYLGIFSTSTFSDKAYTAVKET